MMTSHVQVRIGAEVNLYVDEQDAIVSVDYGHLTLMFGHHGSTALEQATEASRLAAACLDAANRAIARETAARGEAVPETELRALAGDR